MGDAPPPTKRREPPGPQMQPSQAQVARPKPIDPSSMHHGGSFGKYMEYKEIKLREQFEAQVGGLSAAVLGWLRCMHPFSWRHQVTAEGRRASRAIAATAL